MWYTDWRFWSFILSFFSIMGTIGLYASGRWLYLKIKFNDFEHLTAAFIDLKKEQKLDTTKLSKKMDKLDNKIDKNGERIAKVEGYLGK